uniref:TNFR-Cys domain-containing protein n=1 Tax=Pygocentrus nattereri TaxID=42514 RepID=A0A3B4CG92_PYGNA
TTKMIYILNNVWHKQNLSACVSSYVMLLGSHVRKHCTEDSGTSCAPCPASTFTVEQNGLTECMKCTVCDPGQGLRVKTPCTQSSDTVCEPLDGHYCTDEQNNCCVQAVEHKKCRPGQYIKHKGTSSKDTECDECEDGTYSDGSFQTCKPHSK